MSCVDNCNYWLGLGIFVENKNFVSFGLFVIFILFCFSMLRMERRSGWMPMKEQSIMGWTSYWSSWIKMLGQWIRKRLLHNVCVLDVYVLNDIACVAFSSLVDFAWLDNIPWQYCENSCRGWRFWGHCKWSVSLQKGVARKIKCEWGIPTTAMRIWRSLLKLLQISYLYVHLQFNSSAWNSFGNGNKPDCV